MKGHEEAVSGFVSSGKVLKNALSAIVRTTKGVAAIFDAGTEAAKTTGRLGKLGTEATEVSMCTVLV